MAQIKHCISINRSPGNRPSLLMQKIHLKSFRRRVSDPRGFESLRQTQLSSGPSIKFKGSEDISPAPFTWGPPKSIDLVQFSERVRKLIDTWIMSGLSGLSLQVIYTPVRLSGSNKAFYVQINSVVGGQPSHSVSSWSDVLRTLRWEVMEAEREIMFLLSLRRREERQQHNLVLHLNHQTFESTREDFFFFLLSFPFFFFFF